MLTIHNQTGGMIAGNFTENALPNTVHFFFLQAGDHVGGFPQVAGVITAHNGGAPVVSPYAPPVLLNAGVAPAAAPVLGGLVINYW